MDDRLEVPGEQLYWKCSCGNYMSKSPGSLLGVAAHQRKTRCGGSNVAVLPEDFVVADELDAEPDWAIDAQGPDTDSATPGPDAPPAAAGRGQVAQGKVVPPADGGPTRFRGSATAPAGLHAIYDAFRLGFDLEGTFDEWLVDLAELWLEEHRFRHLLVQEVA